MAKSKTKVNRTKSWRVLNRDGTLNVSRDGYKKRFGTDVYHSLLSMAWSEFFSLLIITYTAINLLFASAYFLCGSQALEGIRRDNFFGISWTAFFSVCRHLPRLATDVSARWRLCPIYW